MTTYRTGNHDGVTIVREGIGTAWDGVNRRGDELVAVVVNGDKALADRICALLNADDGAAGAIQNLKLVTDAANDLAARRLTHAAGCVAGVACEPYCEARR